MRTVSSPTSTEIAKLTTRPGYLVEMLTDMAYDGSRIQTLRFSSYGALDWNGFPWAGFNMNVTGFSGDGKSMAVTFFDSTAILRTMFFTGNGPRNKRLRVWKMYQGATGTSDPVQIFEGVSDQVRVNQGQITVTGARFGAVATFAPRKRITVANGFTKIASPGTTISWGGQLIKLGKS